MNFKTYIILKLNQILKKMHHFKIYSIEESIDYILQTNCSVSRFGDGEMMIMNGNSIGFQEAVPMLSQRLKEVIKSNQSNHLVCIPEMLNNTDHLVNRSRDYWNENLRFSRMWWLFYTKWNTYYGNTQITRPYIDFEDRSDSGDIFNKMKLIWNLKDIVIVEGEKSRLGVGNDLFSNASSIKRILCPSKNAFEKYDEILKSCQSLSKDKLVLIALGPTATVLAYDLNRLGYQAIDIGHVDIEYEWFLRGVDWKIKLSNKYVNEGNGVGEICEIKNDIYEQQIFKRII